MKTKILAMGCMLLAAACSPRLNPPQVEIPQHYIHRNDIVATAEGIADGKMWWTIFGDTTLNRLIEKALDKNHEVEEAALRIGQARAQWQITRAAFLPQIGMAVEAEGEYTTPLGVEQTYSVTPTIDWEVSLFGALRQSKRMARAQVAATQWALEGVRLSLAAEVATLYYTMAEYQHHLDIAQRTTELRQASAALIDSMFRYGMSGGVAPEQARSLVYTSQADISKYRQAVEQSRLSMNVLLGELPEKGVAHTTGEESFDEARIAPIPIGLPSELLRRRPDIMEAHFRVEAAAAKAGVARRMRFPSLSLTTKGGMESSSLKKLVQGQEWHGT